ncbi:efflux transporter outer membrane subunit [Sulfurimonas sp.]|uniref:efflux transporter outer membrane subunit n=1 Tax=Sulfurimonas sp. TaxID=2022749 RepID=UPI0026014905|nr:efflux transporter outer membrane subunit [Sulfurimonas sp.]MDD5157922.1 efflux transporter outer membrane subunit [Sulfurimonas sp.]
MNLKLTLLLLLPLLFFSACVPKIQMQKPLQALNIKDDIEKNVVMSDGVKLKVDWYKDYGDSQLNEIIDFALSSSPSIKSIEAKYAQANSIIASKQAGNLPSISADAGISRERFSENYIFPPPLGGGTETLYKTGLSLNYDFDFWGSRDSKILSAKYSAMAQKTYIQEIKLFLSTTICEIYLSWDFDEKRVQLLHEVKKLLEQEENIYLLSLKSGLSDAVMFNTKRSEIAKLNQEVQSIKRSIEAKREAIAMLGGFMPSVADKWSSPNIKSIEVPLPKEILLNLIAHRADIAVQKYIVLSKDQNIQNAKAQFYPNISLSAMTNLISFDLGKFFGHSSFAPSAGVAFSLPIFDGGERKANLSVRTSDYNSSVNDYDNVVIKAANEVVSTLKKTKILESEIELHTKEVEAKDFNVKIAQDKFSAKLANKLPYLQAKREATLTKFGSIDLSNTKALLEVRLIKALGGGYVDMVDKNVIK